MEGQELESRRGEERLRQQAAAFNQNLRHIGIWFKVQVAIVATVIVAFVVVLAVSTYIVLQPAKYTGGAVTASALSLLAEILGSGVAIWKMVLQQKTFEPVAPTTELSPDAE